MYLVLSKLKAKNRIYGSYTCKLVNGETAQTFTANYTGEAEDGFTAALLDAIKRLPEEIETLKVISDDLGLKEYIKSLEIIPPDIAKHIGVQSKKRILLPDETKRRIELLELIESRALELDFQLSSEETFSDLKLTKYESYNKVLSNGTKYEDLVKRKDHRVIPKKRFRGRFLIEISVFSKPLNEDKTGYCIGIVIYDKEFGIQYRIGYERPRLTYNQACIWAVVDLLEYLERLVGDSGEQVHISMKYAPLINVIKNNSIEKWKLNGFVTQSGKDVEDSLYWMALSTKINDYDLYLHHLDPETIEGKKFTLADKLAHRVYKSREEFVETAFYGDKSPEENTPIAVKPNHKNRK